jgi:hypothetical protein
MCKLFSSFVLKFTHLIEEVLPALLGDRWLAAIEQCFSCMHILVYKTVPSFFRHQNVLLLYHHWRVLSRWWSKNRELTVPCRPHTEEFGLHWLVTWCMMCGSGFWLYTCEVIMLPVAGDWQVVFIVSVQQERKCLAIPCYFYAPTPTNRSDMLRVFFKHLLPKTQTSFFCCGV